MGRLVLLLVLYLVALASAVDSFGADKPPTLPSFELSRHFSGGGYEQLKLKCREDRTRSEAFVCELRRLRNGMEVSSVLVDYKWTREQLGKFFRGTASTGGDSGGGQVVLTYDAQSDGERRQGTIHREDKGDQLERVKALMAIEGSLVGEFYR